MLLSLRSQVGALLLAAALLPRPEAAAVDAHPLDPAAPAGVVPTQDPFEALVPLLERESPVPSFVDEAPGATEESSDEGAPMDLTETDRGTGSPGSMDHGEMDHGAPVAGEPE